MRQLAAEKAAAVATKDEKFANVLLGCECLLKGIRAEIMMWLLLKEERADKAWDCLVDAQGFVADAMKADIGFSELQPRIDHLANVERTVFPPQTFFSAGMIVGREECTICGGDYEDCGHIKGRPYSGEFCRVVLCDRQPDHVAIVDHPANKHCRVLTYTTTEGKCSKTTLLVEPYKEGEGPPEEGMVASGVIAHLAPDKPQVATEA